MSYNNLGNYYSTVFSLKQHHNYNMTEIENWIPFEREIYLNMILGYLQELKEVQASKDNKTNHEIIYDENYFKKIGKSK